MNPSFQQQNEDEPMKRLIQQHVTDQVCSDSLGMKAGRFLLLHPRRPNNRRDQVAVKRNHAAEINTDILL